MAVELKFYVGQIVHHKRFNYRAVVCDVDPEYQGTDGWYEQVAKSRPPKDKPWYRVLIDGTDYDAYVAEPHLEPDDQGQPICHPQLDDVFTNYSDGTYTIKRH